LPKCVGKNFGIQREKEDIPLQPEVEHNMNKTKKNHIQYQQINQLDKLARSLSY
jgi:hypothetical protein